MLYVFDNNENKEVFLEESIKILILMILVYVFDIFICS